MLETNKESDKRVKKIEIRWNKWVINPVSKFWKKIANIHTLMAVAIILGIMISIFVYKRIPTDSKWMFWLWLMK